MEILYSTTKASDIMRVMRELNFCKGFSSYIRFFKGNAVRIIDTLDHIDTEMKVRYLINASRSVSAGFVELPDYFRICNAIRSVIQEDLQFLANHIAEEDVEYSDSVQSLLSAGLMYQSVIDCNGNQRYSFTPLGELVDRFSVSYDNVERYPNPKFDSQEAELKVSIPALEWNTIGVASDAEVEEMLDDVFGKE